MLNDFLIRIKNAQKAQLESVKTPYSNMDWAVAELLAANKYIEAAEKKGRMPKRIIEVRLLYINGKGAISGINVLSAPSRRLYSGYKDLKSVRQGYGLGIISTPKGIMTMKDARKAKVGGQLLFEIW